MVFIDSCVIVASYKTIIRMQYSHLTINNTNGKQNSFITSNYTFNFKANKMRKKLMNGIISLRV
jgi:hypothetical protein